jgi:hypothetical protein
MVTLWLHYVKATDQGGIMTTTPDRASAAERIRVAEDAANELRAALSAEGITLPSLRIDPVSIARDMPTPLVDLGCCPPGTARLLAAALRAGAR